MGRVIVVIDVVDDGSDSGDDGSMLVYITGHHSHDHVIVEERRVGVPWEPCIGCAIAMGVLLYPLPGAFTPAVGITSTLTFIETFTPL